MRNVPFLKSKFQVEVQDEADESVLAEIFSLREYAPIEPSLKTARRGILDVGGHKGYFVLYLRALNPTVPIWTYEPEQKNFALLKEHVRLNHLEGVQVKNVAVAAEEGTLLLNVSEDSHNHSLVVQPGTAEQQKVNATTLGKILNKMQGCDLIKMDCEGAEFQILENAGPAVFEVPEFFLEYHEYGPTMKATNLKVLFEQQGFSVKLTPSKFDKRMGFLWARKK
jgi:FkbM family methyltransferase